MGDPLAVQKSFALKIEHAFRIRTEVERLDALHRLVHVVISMAIEERREGAETDLVDRYGAIHRMLRERAVGHALNEIDIAINAGKPDCTHAICAFAIKFAMPVELAERCILGADPGLLLLACRSDNFAWSTVNALLALNPQNLLDQLFTAQCNEDYHMLAAADAQRFMRLLRVNLNNRGATHVQADEALRTNVR